MRWIPDRKVIAGGIGGIAGWLLLQLLLSLGVEIAPEDYEYVTGIIVGIPVVVAYFVPQSVKDVLRKGDEFLKRILAGVEEENGDAPAGGNGGASALSVAIVCVLAVTLLTATACSPGSLFSVEDEAHPPATAEQLAFARVGQFTVIQAAAIEVMKDPFVPDEIKVQVADTEAAAFAAVMAYVTAVRAGAEASEQQARLDAAAAVIAVLESIVLQHMQAPDAEPAVLRLPQAPPGTLILLVTSKGVVA